MGNCISKTFKGLFFAFEEGMKSKTSFEKGRVRRGLDMVTSGTYMKLYSVKRYSKTLPPSQAGMLWKSIFKNELGM